MMMEHRLKELVPSRAKNRCEYCRLPQELAPLVQFHIEHVIAKKHRGSDSPSNLAFSCNRCNFAKGSNLSGIDVVTNRLTPLFHPRRHKWRRHFRWNGALIEGLTAMGRATVAVLDMNEERRMDLREMLIAEDWIDGE